MVARAWVGLRCDCNGRHEGQLCGGGTAAYPGGDGGYTDLRVWLTRQNHTGWTNVSFLVLMLSCNHLRCN